MQSIDFLQVLPAAGILVLILLISYFLLRERRISKAYRKLKESGDYRRMIIDEASSIRHEYNNIFQTVLNLSEEETGLSEYRLTLTDRVHKLNENSLAQMGKIKSDSVLRAVFRLYRYAEKECIELKVFVNQVIQKECPCEEELYNILKQCLDTASCGGTEKHRQVRLGIRETEHGYHFSFDCQEGPGTVGMDIYPFSVKKLRRRLTYNTYIREGRFIQEVMISLI